MTHPQQPGPAYQHSYSGPPPGFAPPAPGYPQTPPPLAPSSSDSGKLAGWALALSLLPIPATLVVGVVLAIVVLVRARRTGDRAHRGRAVAALALAGCWFVLGGGLVAASLLSQTARDENGRVTEAGTLSLEDLRVSDCFDLPGGDQTTLLTVEAIPCGEPHDAEVYALFDLAGGDYPGSERVDRAAMGGCLERFEGYVGESYDDSALEIYYLTPLEAGWETQDDRGVVCAATADLPLTTTVRGTGT